jgi:hypothetical protein
MAREQGDVSASFVSRFRPESAAAERQQDIQIGGQNARSAAQQNRNQGDACGGDRQ